MRKTLIFLGITMTILIGLVIILSPVQAQTITIANPGGIAERDLIVYYANGTMQGFYNTTSVITLIGSQDYIFTLKPIGANLLEDPGDFLTALFLYVKTNVIALIILILLIGLLILRRKS
jgi:hypothetical protein